ncbi:MAG: hypothetical protein LBR80_18480 [Deltaproteobacteria bacterium]|jgi:hypothetical protein|nr:hypothetical protein [Deltaproteobacteria bacterium]
MVSKLTASTATIAASLAVTLAMTTLAFPLPESSAPDASATSGAPTIHQAGVHVARQPGHTADAISDAIDMHVEDSASETPSPGPKPAGTEGAGTPPNIEWIRTYGGSGLDLFRSAAKTSDGGIIAAGCSMSADGDAESNRGKADSWILKLDSEGAVIWKRSIGGSGGECANFIDQAPDGAYFVAGTTESFDGDFLFRKSGELAVAAWAARLAPGGATEWLRGFGAEAMEQPLAAGFNQDNNYILVGDCNPLFGECPGCPASAWSGKDSWDRDGSEGSQRTEETEEADSSQETESAKGTERLKGTESGQNSEYENNVISQPGSQGRKVPKTLEDAIADARAVFPPKNLLTVILSGNGETVSSSCVTLPRAEGISGTAIGSEGGAVIAYSAAGPGWAVEAHIAVYDPGGVFRLQLPVPSAGTAWPRAVAPAQGGGFVGAGAMAPGKPAGPTSPWVFRTPSPDRAGWEALPREELMGNLLAVAPSDADCLFAVGFATNTDIGARRMDLLAVKADADGKILWTTLLGGSGMDIAYSAVELQDGGLLAAGSTDSRDGDLVSRTAPSGEEPDTDGIIVRFAP